MNRLIESSAPRRNRKTQGGWISGLAILFALTFAGTASAQVTITYTLTPDSNLITEISSAADFFAGTGLTPSWLAPGAATPPVPPYAPDSEATTLNTMTVTFANDDGNGGPAAGPVTIDSMDWWHPTDAGIAGTADILGQNDSTVGGAMGTMDGSGVVTIWSAPLTGEIHNELSCDNIATGTLCGSFGLPADGTTQVDHQSVNAALLGTIAIDTSGSPVAASLPMTFTNSFQDVSMQMTLATSPGRQYYQIVGTVIVPPVPALGGWGAQILMIGLLALVGVFAMNGKRFSFLTTRSR